MTEENTCSDGFCPFHKKVEEKKPEDIFFSPVEESTVCEDSKIRQKFIRFCDENPDHEECRIYDV